MFAPKDTEAFVRQFDLVAGTSTGAILAAGLGAGLSPAALVKFYIDHGPKIFNPKQANWHWATNKYDSHALDGALDKLEARTFEKSICRLVIPAIDAKTGNATLFHTPHAKLRTAYAQMQLKHAVLASTAAPTYFEQADLPVGIHSNPYLDGGLWANNPSIPAICEAVGALGVPIEQIDVLSVGTTTSEQNFTRLSNAGLAQYAVPLKDLFFASQESGTIGVSRILLSKSRYLRINRYVKNLTALDDSSRIGELIVEGGKVAKESYDEVLGRFLKTSTVKLWEKFV